MAALNTESRDAAFEAMEEAFVFSLSGAFYVEKAGNAAIQTWVDAIAAMGSVNLHNESLADLCKRESRAISPACTELIEALTKELRADYGLDASLPAVRLRNANGAN